MKMTNMAAFIPMEMINACYGSSYTYKEVKWKSIKNGYTHFSDGDIAFAKITPCFQNRKSAVFENLPNGIGAGTTELKVLRPYVNTVNPYYLLFFLETPYFVEEASFKGTANQQRIISGYLEGKLFPLPPKAEQDRIVKQVQQLLPLTDKYESAFEANLRQQDSINTLLRKSILQEAIQGKLVPQLESEGTAEELLAEIAEEKKRLVKDGKLKKSALTASRIFRGDDNWYYEQIGSDTIDISDLLPFTLPDNWRWCRLSNVIQLLSGRDLEPTEYNDSKLGIPYMTGASNFSNEKLLVNRWTERPVTISVIGDLLITCKGTIGQMAFNSIGEIHIARQIMAIRGIVISLEYIKCFLETMLNSLQKQAKSMIPGISREVILNALLPLPPLDEQIRIVKCIKAISKSL